MTWRTFRRSRDRVLRSAIVTTIAEAGARRSTGSQKINETEKGNKAAKMAAHSPKTFASFTLHIQTSLTILSQSFLVHEGYYNLILITVLNAKKTQNSIIFDQHPLVRFQTELSSWCWTMSSSCVDGSEANIHSFPKAPGALGTASCTERNDRHGKSGIPQHSWAPILWSLHVFLSKHRQA